MSKAEEDKIWDGVRERNKKNALEMLKKTERTKKHIRDTKPDFE